MQIHHTHKHKRGTTSGPVEHRGRHIIRPLVALVIALASFTIAAPADATIPGVSLVRGNLTITGTNANEEIEIVARDNPGQLQVSIKRGSDILGAVYEDVTGRVTIRGRGGDDTLTILGSIVVGGDFNFDGGSGDDRILLDSSSGLLVHGRLMLRGGAGDDDFRLWNVHVKRTSKIISGSGALAVDGTWSVFEGRLDVTGGQKSDIISLADSRFDGGARIRTAVGDDRIRLSYNEGTKFDIDSSSGHDIVTTVENNIDELALRTGTGNDQISLQADDIVKATVAAGSGDDSYRDSSTKASTYTVKGEGGNDTMVFDHSGSGRSSFLGGSGNDFIQLLEHTASEAITIDAGAGDDETVIDRSVFEEEFVWKGGSGADEVRSFGSIYGYTSLFDGGSGTDSLDGEANSFGLPADIRSVP